jgi:hypothetical protein
VAGRIADIRPGAFARYTETWPPPLIAWSGPSALQHSLGFPHGENTMSHASASNAVPSAEAHPEGDVFQKSFSDEERRALLAEDREAQLGISAILSLLIATGMVLGILSVLLVLYLGI